MNPALRPEAGAMRVNLTVPTTAVRLGPFSFDGLKAFLGVDLAEILAPMMVAPRYTRDGLDVYPLAIPDGEGLTIPVKLMGEIGFYNLRAMLVLVVPPAVAEVVRAQLAAEIAAGTAAGPRFNEGGSGGIVAEFAVKLRPGMRKAVPLGSWGEVGVEAG